MYQSLFVCKQISIHSGSTHVRLIIACAYSPQPIRSGVHVFDDAPGSASSLAIIDQLISTLRAMADDASSAWRRQTRRVLLRCVDAAVGSGQIDMGRAVCSEQIDMGLQPDSMDDDAATVPRDCVMGALAVLGMRSSLW